MAGETDGTEQWRHRATVISTSAVFTSQSCSTRCKLKGGAMALLGHLSLCLLVLVWAASEHFFGHYVAIAKHVKICRRAITSLLQTREFLRPPARSPPASVGGRFGPVPAAVTRYSGVMGKVAQCSGAGGSARLPTLKEKNDTPDVVVTYLSKIAFRRGSRGQSLRRFFGVF